MSILRSIVALCTVLTPITMVLFSLNAYALNSNHIRQQVDVSGKITVAVFERVAGNPQQHFYDFAVEVPDQFVAIGGGVEGTNYPQGNLLTASYPNNDLSAWLVSTKDHVSPNSTRITAYALGLKIEGLSRNQLLSQINVNTRTSGYVQHPDVSVGVPEGFVMIGGGFKVNWLGAGNLATASYPETIFDWRAKSKDHVIYSPAWLQVYAIGVREYIDGIGSIIVDINTGESGFAQHPASTANVTPGFALTGCGADVHWSGAGNLLWKIKPNTQVSQHGCQSASKDHEIISPATITTYSVGIQLRQSSSQGAELGCLNWSFALVRFLAFT